MRGSATGSGGLGQKRLEAYALTNPHQPTNWLHSLTQTMSEALIHVLNPNLRPSRPPHYGD